MNREQLEEVRKRASKATPGPWRIVLDDSESATTVWQRCESTLHPEDDSEQLGVYDECCIDGGLHSEPFYREADAEFVAAARTDVPALLDEIDRLTAVAWKLRTVMIQQHEAGSHFLWIDDCPACVKARDECDGDFSCDQQKAWQKGYEEALSLPLAAATTAEGSAEGGTSKGSEVTP